MSYVIYAITQSILVKEKQHISYFLFPISYILCPVSYILYAITQSRLARMQQVNASRHTHVEDTTSSTSTTTTTTDTAAAATTNTITTTTTMATLSATRREHSAAVHTYRAEIARFRFRVRKTLCSCPALAPTTTTPPTSTVSPSLVTPEILNATAGFATPRHFTTAIYYSYTF